MLDFFDSGGYHLYSRLREEYPHITMLDLHVHCYIIGDKYDISSLANYAAVNYLRIAADILSLDWQYDDPNYYDDSLSKLAHPLLMIHSPILQICLASTTFHTTCVPQQK